MSGSGGGASFLSGIGGILTGISELLLALGAGIGFLIRGRRNHQRERLRTEAAAALAAREAKKALEEKLEAQHSAQIDQYKSERKELQAMQKIQIAQLESQLAVQQSINSNLLNRLLEADKND